MTETVQPFEADVSRVLDLVINSLYKERDIFLRELISNASDACDKLRYQSLSQPELLETDPDLKIRILADAALGLLTVTDNGIGMNREDLCENLGTIARSGTARFLEQLSGDKDKDLKLIGQFGVGFYSVFMVADKVVVQTRKAGEDKSWIWASDGRSGYTVQEAPATVPRGTSITLHLKADAKEYLDGWKIRQIVRTYSDHIGIPILLEVREKAGDGKAKAEEPQQINEASAIWTRPKSEISEDQYREFYHHVAHAFDEPFARLHFTAEGVLSYTALLFVPSTRPFDLFDPKRRHGVKLYVRRVFITSDLEALMPRYLRFVSGVVDSEDLQLNVSRETLQHGAVIAKMKKALVRRLLDEIAAKAKASTAASADGEAKPDGEAKTKSYEDWWAEFGSVLKEGLYEDAENREKLLELARFRSTHGAGWTSLADYVARMKEGQDAIYYISGESHTALRTSPQLEQALAKGVEVLLLDDPVDDFWLPEVKDYQGKPFRSLTRGEVDLSAIKAEGEAEKESEPKLDDEALKRLIARLKTALGEEVTDIRSSKRLRDSAVCLVADEHGLDLRLERFLKQHSQIDRLSKRVLEINGQHELIRRMAEMAKDETKGLQFDELARLLLDQARIVEGEPIPDPGAFSRRMSTFLAKGLAA
ncbi:molecular chaperone HtpG [Benzoatithermus flavus]|uniref:Chaperone protein HtpG n=1 Tax=Benzoatithermus flavus TaxID=3108223 RepID=A0ABU8XKY0_9PROT